MPGTELAHGLARESHSLRLVHLITGHPPETYSKSSDLVLSQA